MSEFMKTMTKRAQACMKTIVLPEGNDDRVMRAAETIVESRTANLVILGNPTELKAKYPKLGDTEIIDHKSSPLRDNFAEKLHALRAHKGVDLEKAFELLEDSLYFGVMMVKTGMADGMVAGACHSTGDVLRPSLQILKTAPGVKYVSSFFVMNVPNCEYGDNGTFIFSDCGLEVQPSAEQLAHIAVNSSRSWTTLFGTKPHVAMLSHSTYGSSKKEDALKVVEATRLAKELDPNVDLDGELQLDAAIVPEVAQAKAPDSPVAGHANVLIFPDLDAGNIGYKLVQRLAHAEAYGPITQGIAAPVNDLSRGCSAEDVAGVITLTCVQAQ